jgi:hypothetical protein
MGVDPGLIDMALKIPFAQMHYLSRAEIAGYGIDTRGFQETRWTTANTSDAALAVFKVLTEARVRTARSFAPASSGWPASRPRRSSSPMFAGSHRTRSVNRRRSR